MKVKYLVDKVTASLPVYGKIYDVISIEAGWYRVMNEDGVDSLYHPKAFEIVDQYPEPPVLTLEEIRAGQSGKYQVVDEWGDYLKYFGLSRDDDWETIDKRTKEFEENERGEVRQKVAGCRVGNRKRELAFA